MIKTLPYKTKQFFVLLMKLSIVVGAFYLIYDKLTNNPQLTFQVFVENISKSEMVSIKTVLFLLLLTLLNWILEILKWRSLVSTVKIISFKLSMEQSLGALTASLLTPNRIGEYGAKAMYYPKSFRKKIMMLNLVGNILQMTTTVLFGIVGLVFVSKNHALPLDYFKIMLFAIAGIAFLIILYFSLKKLRFEVKGFSIKRIIRFIFYIPLDITIKASVLSVFRYVVFSFQFYFLLIIFGVSIDYFNAMMWIGSMYLVSSIIPSVFIFDVVIKGSVAVFLFSIIGVNDLTILCVVTLMWLFNFVIPSVIGSLYVLNFKLPIENINP